MKIRDLEYFIDTARLGSLSKTAQLHHVSQPTVSNGLFSLEKELGYSLFDRSPSGISLTSIGKLALPYAQECLKNKQLLISLATEKPVSLRIATFSLACSSIMMDTFSLFNKKYPEITFQIHDMRPSKILTIVNQNLYSLAIGGEPEDSFSELSKEAQNMGLIIEPLYLDPFVIFLSPSNLLSKQATLNISDLLEEPFASYNDFFLRKINPYCKFHNIFGFSDQESIKKMVADNKAISFFPKLLIYKDFYFQNNLITYRYLNDYKLNLIHYILHRPLPELSVFEQMVISDIKQSYASCLQEGSAFPCET